MKNLLRFSAGSNQGSFRGMVATSCAVVLLSACASFKGIETSGTLRQPADYSTAESLPDQHGQWPDTKWAQAIGGASLQSLIDEAIAGNPNLQIAAARVAAVTAMTDAADAASRPSVSASFDSTYQRFSENYIIPPPYAGTYRTDNALRLNFSYDFDFWGKHAGELRSALSQGKAAQAEQYNARLVIATSVARTWIQLARQYAQLDLNQQQLDVTAKIAHLTQLRLDAGLDAKSENQQTRQQVASLGAEHEQLLEQISLTRNQLAALLGQGPDRGRQIERPVLPADVAIALPDTLPLELLGRRPDIVAARWQVEAVQGDISAAKAAFYPNINLMAYAGFSSIGLNNLLKSGSRIVGVGPAITMPILEGRTLRANLKGRVAEYDSMVATYNRALTDALHDVADQVTSLRAVALQSEQQKKATQAASGNLDLAQQRERIGTTNMLPALAAEMTLLSQRRVDLDLQARRSDLRIGLIKALGGGFDAQAQGLAIEQNSTPSNVSTSVRSAS
ncbi:NodT family efflux transporter outer membrane factor (OMF) lipoprotein [Herminiimonas fonticola]|uniref:NodT family efflux transporter outer membrane factor (OMF) lipoprotein n=2 Tax=Herminiimonas fonticola TaxID=303380 RepID=A0A4R6G7D0_9BURK|nr:efflux transporter, outer membrane factor (OMF) lipoprotein, NodT family [Herminiimonas fonticola]TDN89890.1 NodT family efflux transporter outer membrane factor (OMF) lipoprotein [Herminiimonas fonticola]